MDAAEVLARHYAARGGLERLFEIRTLYQRGTVTLRDGTLLQMQGWRKRPNLLKIAFQSGDDQGREGYDGSRAWEAFPWRTPAPVYVSDAPELGLRRASDFDGPLVHPHDKGHRIAYLGETAFQGSPVHALRLTLEDGNENTYYFATADFLLLAHESVRHVHAKEPSLTTTVYSDYRPVAGVLFAFHSIESAHLGAHQETFAWSQIEANVELAPDFFALPQRFDGE